MATETDALKDLLFRMADDALIVAHRNSEWTGLGPLIEEDIAFSSIAQDKLGHAHALYALLNDMGEGDPDQLAFNRPPGLFRSCHLVELPIGQYDFSLVRHFLFDNAESIRYDLLATSTCIPLAQLARKVKGEIKYHVFHADNWMAQLGVGGDDESRSRMQDAVDSTVPIAFGMFEPVPTDDVLASTGIFPGESMVSGRWVQIIQEKLAASGYSMPVVADRGVGYGGRAGTHTAHLEPLLHEMSEVFRIDPLASW